MNPAGKIGQVYSWISWQTTHYGKLLRQVISYIQNRMLSYCQYVTHGGENFCCLLENVGELLKACHIYSKVGEEGKVVSITYKGGSMAAKHLSDLSHSIDIHIRLDIFTDRGREEGRN